MNKRKAFVGRLRVYRTGPLSETLSASVIMEDNKEFYYWVAPKAFVDIIDPIHNRCTIRFTADENGNNPRGIKKAC